MILRQINDSGTGKSLSRDPYSARHTSTFIVTHTPARAIKIRRVTMRVQGAGR